MRPSLLPSGLSALKYLTTVATLRCPVSAIVLGSGMFWRPASGTKPALSECAEKLPSTPARAQRSLAVSGKNRHYELASIMRRDFNVTAARCGWGDNAEDIIGELLAMVEPAIENVEKQLPAGFPEDVAHAIFEGIRSQAKRLQEQPPS